MRTLDLGRPPFATTCVFVLALSGCGESEPEPRLPPPRPRVTEVAHGPAEPPATGPLPAGSEKRAGFPIPLGFAKKSETPTSATFEGNAEAPRVVAYVRSKITQGRFVEVGDGGRFFDAVPTGADRARVRLTIRVVSTAPRRTSLEITSQPTEAAPPMSEEERMRAWQEELRRLD